MYSPPSCFRITIAVAFLLVVILQCVSLLGTSQATAADELAERPHWPVGLDVPKGAPPSPKNIKGAAILAWVPPKVTRIRALLMIRANTDSKHFGEHAALRRVAEKHEMAIIYLRYYQHLQLASNPRDKVIFQILDSVASATGIDEIRHAPWITFGKSSVGRFPFYLAWAYPERTIGTICYHAETPTWPPERWASVDKHTILHVNLNGETEWGGTWNRHVRPSLLNYRAKTAWLPHLALAHDVGHGNYLDVHGSSSWGKKFPGKVTCIRVWDYLALYVDKALSLRLPEGEYPTKRPITLKQVDPTTGYLIRPYGYEDIFKLPRIPMTREDDAYVVDPAGDDMQATFVAIALPKGFKPPSGVPLEPLVAGQLPKKWLVTEGLAFAMEKDPMRDLNGLKSLKPRLGERVTIDGKQATFTEMKPHYARREGGITLNNGLQTHDKATLLAYTVLDVPRRSQLKLNAPFTQNGRVQVVLAGTPVAHGQIVELDRGLYPMLVVVRLRTKWSSLRTGFDQASADEVRNAKKYTAQLAAQAAELDDESDGPVTPTDAPMIRKFADVPEDQRGSWFWIADRDLADAWLRLHNVHRLKFK